MQLLIPAISLTMAYENRRWHYDIDEKLSFIVLRGYNYLSMSSYLCGFTWQFTVQYVVSMHHKITKYNTKQTKKNTDRYLSNNF